MRQLDVEVATDLKHTPRVKQLSGMFDVPARDKLTQRWQAELPLDERDWRVGLIVGPSGSGSRPSRGDCSVSRDARMDGGLGVRRFRRRLFDLTDCRDLSGARLQHHSKPDEALRRLSTGENFRVDSPAISSSALPRSWSTNSPPWSIGKSRISVSAVQKYVRKHQRRFVAATCHYDVIDLLKPDWTLEPATMTFQWRPLQRRPERNVEIARAPFESWKLFAPFHYLTAELHRGAAASSCSSKASPPRSPACCIGRTPSPRTSRASPGWRRCPTIRAWSGDDPGRLAGRGVSRRRLALAHLSGHPRRCVRSIAARIG